MRDVRGAAAEAGCSVRLGDGLSLKRIVLVALASALVIGAFVYTSFEHRSGIPNGRDLYIRANTTPNAYHTNPVIPVHVEAWSKP